MHFISVKLNVLFKTILLITIISFSGLNNSFGANRFSVASGNWNSTSSWSTKSGGGSGASVPVAGDIVTIEGADNITVSANAACASIQIGSTTGGGGAGTITFNSGVTLTVSGAVVLGNTGSTSRFGTITMTLGGTLSCASLTSNSSTDVFTEGSGTIILTSTNTFPIANVSGALNSFNNVTISAGTTSLLANTTILGNLIINSGATLSTGTFTIGGGGSLTNNGTLNTSGAVSINTLSNAGTMAITGSGVISTIVANFTNTGTINLGGSGTIAGITNNAGGIVNLSSSGTITTFNNATSTSTLNISASSVPTITTLTSTVTGNTINYSGAAQTIKATSYSNLTLSGTGAKTFPSGTTTVNGVLSIENGANANVFTGSLSYGSSATLQYNTTSARTAGAEWITPFVATGGIVNANSGTITINGSVTLTTGLSLTGGDIAIGANTLTLNGNFSGSRSNALVGGATSNLVIGNTGTIGTLYIDQTTVGTTNRLQNLTVSRNGSTITLGSIFEVTGTVTLSNGTLASAGFLTLVSNASGTARIDALAGTGAITGNVTVQRYIPGGNTYDRAYRFLASPASGQTFAAAWQQDIHITGAGTGGTVCPSLSANSNGFDRNVGNTPSIYTYSETTGAWTPIANTTSTTLNSSTGYRVFVRGNRSQGCTLLETSGTPAVYGTPTAVTIKASGTITTGTVNTALTNTVGKGAGWNLVTNPYPSAIDWNNATWVSAKDAKIGTTIYIWNPASGVGNVGAYAAYNTASHTATNGGSNIIQSGQSFWVQTTGAATLTFQEAYKSTDQTTQVLGKTELANNLKIQLKDTAVLDEAVVFTYAGATNNIENVDGPKMSFTTGSVATFTAQNDTALTFNAVGQFSEPDIDTIFMKTGLVASKSYTLNFIGAKSFSNNIHPYLFDRYTSILIDLTTTPSYFFTTNTIAGSISQTRFYLVFADPSTLPVVLNNFTAQKNNKSVLLKWSTSSEINSAAFVIERSNDAVNYQEIATVKAAGNSSQNLSYSTIDAQPNLSDVNYYRLKQIDADGKFTYSLIQAVDFKIADNATINVFPNPVTGDHITVSLADNKNITNISVIDILGRTISNRNNIQSKGDYSLPIDMLQKGAYIIKITSDGGQTYYRKIEVE